MSLYDAAPYIIATVLVLAFGLCGDKKSKQAKTRTARPAQPRRRTTKRRR